MERILQTAQYLIRAALIIAIVWAAVSRSWEVLALATGALLIITALPFFVERYYKLYLPLELETYITLFTFAALFLGAAANFYNRFWWWDDLLHSSSAIISGLIAFVLMYSLWESGRVNARPVTISIFIFTFALAIGAVWEIIEFTIDLLFNTDMQKNSLTDTMVDLTIDAAGAATVAITSYIYLRSKKLGPFNYIIESLKKKNPNLFSKKL